MGCFVVGIVSQKGGSGKSTVARLVAREAALDDELTVLIADLDHQQQTATAWASTRAKQGLVPPVTARAFEDLRTARAFAAAAHVHVVLLDGRPHAGQQTVEIARAAHLIVIPTGQTVDDLRPSVHLAHELVDAGTDPARLAFALVRVTNSAAEVRAAREYLEESGYFVIEGAIRGSTAYGSAHDQGKTLTETPYATLNTEAATVARAVIARLMTVTQETSR